MRRRWLAGLVLAVLLLGSSATSADPTNWGQLAQIILCEAPHRGRRVRGIPSREAQGPTAGQRTRSRRGPCGDRLHLAATSKRRVHRDPVPAEQLWRD
jgi:hypothetical protein